MTTMYDFGIRTVPPCGDCYDDGHCSMNCGPKVLRLESLPLAEKVSPAACMGHRIPRPLCPCCGGHAGIRRARNDRKGRKPRYKDHH